MSQVAGTLPAGDVATPLHQPQDLTLSCLQPLMSSPSHVFTLSRSLIRHSGAGYNKQISGMEASR